MIPSESEIPYVVRVDCFGAINVYPMPSKYVIEKDGSVIHKEVPSERLLVRTKVQEIDHAS
jgi:hypothetical protein